MDSQNDSTDATPPQTDASSTVPETTAMETPVQTTAPVAPPKSHKKRTVIIIVSVLLLAIIAGGTAYMLLGRGSDTSTSDTPGTSKSSESTASSAVQSAADAYTGGISDETQLTETDDSKLGDDASTSASKVGDSIDENNL